MKIETILRSLAPNSYCPIIKKLSSQRNFPKYKPTSQHAFSKYKSTSQHAFPKYKPTSQHAFPKYKPTSQHAFPKSAILTSRPGQGLFTGS